MNATITLPQTMIKRLEKLAANSRHDPQALIRQAIVEKLDYEEWKAEKIRAGLTDIQAGRTIAHDEMVRRMESKMKAAKNARKKAA